MRIYMVCPSYPPQDVSCGVGDYTRCLTEELVRQGEEVLVLTADRYRGRTDGAVSVQPTVQTWTLRTAWWVAGSRGRPPVDLVHLQYTPDLYGPGLGFKLTPLLARLRRAGLPTLVTFHTLIGGPPWTKVAALVLLMAAHRSISANEEVSALLRRYVPTLTGRWVEIPIGTNIHVTPAAETLDKRTERVRLGLPEDAPLLAHFGLVYPGKGLETLMAALPKILRHERRARLVIVGDTRPENHAYRSTLEALADRLGVAPAIIWSGRRSNEEVSRILQVSDLFVVPYDEGVSIRRGSLMAGLAHSLPVISTRSPVSSSYLKDGVNLALVPPRDADALATQVAALLAAPGEAARLAKAAGTLAEQFSWPAIARAMRALYAEVVRR